MFSERAFFSFVDVTEPKYLPEYHDWHTFDHLPENHALPGVAWGERWTRIAGAGDVETVAGDLAGVDTMTMYWFRPPYEESLAEWSKLGIDSIPWGRGPGIPSVVRRFALSDEADYLSSWQYPPGATYIDALPEAPPLPWKWLSEAELELYVENYSASGFTGGLNWYRVSDLRWEQRKAYQGKKITVPYFFIGSSNDIDLAVWHGENPLEQLHDRHQDVRDVRTLERAEHMMQMERPDAVNDAMVEFRESL